MKNEQEVIDYIVCEVVRRLQDASAQEPARKDGNRWQAANHAPSSELHLTLPVITLARLEGRLTSVRTVVVNRSAIVTPAVRDLLREKNIALRTTENSAAASRAQSREVVVGVAESRFDPAALLRAVASERVLVEQVARSGLLSVIEEIVGHVLRSGQLGLLFTSQVTAALCIANRQRGVRAAAGRCAATTREAVESVGVNLLVVDPTGKSTFELKRMIGVLLAGGGHCPDSWPQALR